MAKISTLLKLQKNESERGDIHLGKQLDQVKNEINALQDRKKSIDDAIKKLQDRKDLILMAKADLKKVRDELDLNIAKAEAEELTEEKTV